MDHLINKYINNSLTPGEADQLKQWLQEDIDNRIEFENIVAHIKHSDAELDAIKRRVLNKLVSEPEAEATGKLGVHRKISRSLKVAAMLALVFTSVFLLLDNQYWVNEQVAKEQLIEIEKEAAKGQNLTFKLSDGTTVKLNAGSKLIFPKAFGSRNRVVRLVGEAFFDVARDENKPFKIETNQIGIAVLGTSFNVRSYEESETVIGVKTGIVKVTSAQDPKGVLVTRNLLATYSPGTNRITSDTIRDSSEIFGWIDKELVFKDYTIDQIFTELSRWYDVEFKIEGKLDVERKFTTRYKNPTLKSVMESLSYVYKYKYKIDEKTVTIM